jgi:DNA invertase Pin-like site-specific DNA recombinase
VGDWLLVVWKLDRLGLSLSHLVEFINNFKNKEIGFKSL